MIDVDVELERADTYVDLTTDIKRLIYLHTLFYVRLTYFSMNTKNTQTKKTALLNEWLVVDVDWYKNSLLVCDNKLMFMKAPNS